MTDQNPVSTGMWNLRSLVPEELIDPASPTSPETAAGPAPRPAPPPWSAPDGTAPDGTAPDGEPGTDRPATAGPSVAVGPPATTDPSATVGSEHPFPDPEPGPGGRPATIDRRVSVGIATAVVALIVGAIAVNAAGEDGTDTGSPGGSVPWATEPTWDDGNATEDAGAYGGSGVTATEEATTAPSDPPTDQESAALAELDRLRQESLPTVSFENQFVAQLASKSVGIVDPYQTTSSGSHRFHAADILAEHLALRAGTGGDAPVVLLLSTDFGKRQRYRGEPLWVTFALGDFRTAAAVTAWCAARFPSLSGKELANQCAVRRLAP